MATTAVTRSVVGVQKKITMLEAGMNKDFTAKNSLTVAGASMTQVQILNQLDSYDDLYTAVANAKSAMKVAEAALEAALPGVKAFIEGLEAAVKAQLGVRSPLLADFGIGVPGASTVKRSSAEKAVSAALTKQTKAVRGIIGPKARSKITVSGTPGLVLVGPNGAPLPVSTLPPLPPGVSPIGGSGSTPASAPAAVSSAPAGNTAATPAAGSTTPATGAGNTGSTPAAGG